MRRQLLLLAQIMALAQNEMVAAIAGTDNGLGSE
jgi:hypothetical protein